MEKSCFENLKKKLSVKIMKGGGGGGEGLKMFDIENFIQAMKMSWMKRILKGSAKWQSIIGADIDINIVL
jgi:hypothetical protein